MPIKSRWEIDIPSVSLPTYLFNSPTAALPDKPAIIDSEHPDTVYLTQRTYRLWAQRLAAGLQAAGLKRGDRVLLFSGNTIFFPVVFIGIIMAGGVFTGANPGSVARELAYQLSNSEAAFLIAAEGGLDTAIEAAAIAGLSKDRIFAFDGGSATFEGRAKAINGIESWNKLLVSEEEGSKFKWAEITEKDELKNTVAGLNYSSGTTGVPKGVMITHWNYVANTTQTRYVAQLGPEYEETTARSRQMCFLPMYHAMAQTIFCVSAPKRRVPVYIMPKFDFLKMLENVQRFRITELVLVPPIVVAMIKHPATKKFDLSSIEFVGSGAAPLKKEVCSEMEGLWPEGKINLTQGWGMTEATCTVTIIAHDTKTQVM